MYGDDLDLPIKRKVGRGFEPFAPSETERRGSGNLPTKPNPKGLAGRQGFEPR